MDNMKDVCIESAVCFLGFVCPLGSRFSNVYTNEQCVCVCVCERERERERE